MSFSPRSIVAGFNPSFVLRNYLEDKLDRIWMEGPVPSIVLPPHQDIEFIGGEAEEMHFNCEYCGQLHAYKSFVGGCPSCGAPVNGRRARMVESRPLLKVTNH